MIGSPLQKPRRLRAVPERSCESCGARVELETFAPRADLDRLRLPPYRGSEPVRLRQTLPNRGPGDEDEAERDDGDCAVAPRRHCRGAAPRDRGHPHRGWSGRRCRSWCRSPPREAAARRARGRGRSAGRRRRGAQARLPRRRSPPCRGPSAGYTGKPTISAAAAAIAASASPAIRRRVRSLQPDRSALAARPAAIRAATNGQPRGWTRNAGGRPSLRVRPAGPHRASRYSPASAPRRSPSGSRAANAESPAAVKPKANASWTPIRRGSRSSRTVAAR